LANSLKPEGQPLIHAFQPRAHAWSRPCVPLVLYALLGCASSGSPSPSSRPEHSIGGSGGGGSGDSAGSSMMSEAGGADGSMSSGTVGSGGTPAGSGGTGEASGASGTAAGSAGKPSGGGGAGGVSGASGLPTITMSNGNLCLPLCRKPTGGVSSVCFPPATWAQTPWASHCSDEPAWISDMGCEIAQVTGGDQFYILCPCYDKQYSPSMASCPAAPKCDRTSLNDCPAGTAGMGGMSGTAGAGTKPQCTSDGDCGECQRCNNGKCSSFGCTSTEQCGECQQCHGCSCQDCGYFDGVCAC
jgi:hypothetical protein